MDEARQRPAARAAILAAAAELIARKGVAGTSISDIVARSGTSAGAIYHHFGNKERLVLEVGRTAVAMPMALIMATTLGLAPAGLFEAALRQVARNEGTAELLLQIWAGARSDPALAELLQSEVTAMRANVESFVAGWCQQHGSGDPAAIVEVLMGLTIGYAVQRGLGLRPELDRYCRTGSALVAEASAGLAVGS